MEKWILAIYSICRDPSREKEFNEWYHQIHLPDILETPGVTRAARYEVHLLDILETPGVTSAARHEIREPAEGQAKYLAMYELETEDVDKTWAAIWEKTSEKREQGRATELLHVVWRALYKQITEPLESKR